MALGDAEDRRLQALQALDRPERVRAREHRHVGGDLVVARAGGVQPTARRTDDLGQAALDDRMDVLVGVEQLELARLELRLDAVEAAEEDVAVALGDDVARREHARMRAGLLDVVGREPVVEADRVVELPEDRVLRLREARHGPP
jgi:hypothetical protein